MKTVPIQPYETIYSWVVRIHLRYGAVYERHTYDALFGHSPISIHPFLPQRALILAVRTAQRPRALMSNHTLLNLFVFFSEDIKAQPSLEHYMLRGRNEKILAHEFVRSARLSNKLGHKYCSICVEEQRETVGYGIYDIRAQLPGVIACPWHGVRLNKMAASRHRTIVKLNSPQPKSDRETMSDVTKSFVRFCHHVIERSLSITTERFDRTRYLIALDRRGYLTKEGRIRQKELRRDAASAVSHLELEPGTEHLLSLYFIGSLLHTKRSYPMHPLQHLLFGWWLFGGEARRFYEDEPPIEQFTLGW